MWNKILEWLIKALFGKFTKYKDWFKKAKNPKKTIVRSIKSKTKYNTIKRIKKNPSRYIKKKTINYVKSRTGYSRIENIWDKVKSFNQDPELAKKYKRAKARNDLLVNKWEDTLARVTQKIMKGNKPNAGEQAAIDAHGQHFMESEEFVNIKSSWILRACYIKADKRLVLIMRNSARQYNFNDVPLWVWLFLVLQPAHAGTAWWNKGFGVKYSSNPWHWMRANQRNKITRRK